MIPPIKVAALQIASRDDESPSERTKRVDNVLDSAASSADLILLPELWQVGYFNFDRYADVAEPAGGEFLDWMSAKAKRYSVHIFTGSFVERHEGRLFNTSALIDPDGRVCGIYRKIHLFGYGSKEQQLLTRGESPVVLKTKIGSFGLCTCYDLRFPELFRRMVDQGAEAFLITSAWPYPRLHHWEVLTAARAIENQSYLVACNAAGMNGGARLLGHSRIVDPWGITLAGAGDHETVLRGEMDLSRVAQIRGEFPALHDRVLK
ncbi:MAG TPA: carbon-nitrogen family hydrolase [Symbiobacteriaceae bacterium]|nr:carbon-nitrogen family hydrolase [Symbiobacteriaceae bacterium]